MTQAYASWYYTSRLQNSFWMYGKKIIAKSDEIWLTESVLTWIMNLSTYLENLWFHAHTTHWRDSLEMGVARQISMTMEVMLFASRSRRSFWSTHANMETISSHPDLSTGFRGCEQAIDGVFARCDGKRLLMRVKHHLPLWNVQT